MSSKTLTRISKKPCSIPSVKQGTTGSRWHGSWGSILTALLALSLLLGLAGCRTPAAKTLPPSRARLADLIALHPSQQLVRDLDAQLARVTAERLRMAGEPVPPALPTEITLTTPELPALPAPSVIPQIVPPWLALYQADISALRGELTHKAARETARFQRRLSTEYAAREEMALVEQARAADTDAVALHEAYRLRITRLQLEQQYAREQFTRYPRSAEAQQRVVKADAEYDVVMTAYNAALQAVRKRQEQANVVAARERERERTARTASHQAELQDHAKQQLAEAEARLQDTAHALPAGEAASGMTFPAQPAGELTLDTATIRLHAAKADTVSTEAKTSAVRALDEQIRTLQRTRTALQAEITADTRALAARLAQQHGYHLSFTRGKGVEQTMALRRWLQEYWQTDIADTEG